MLAQVPHIRFLMDFSSRSALKDRSELRWPSTTRAMSYLSSWQYYLQKELWRSKLRWPSTTRAMSYLSSWQHYLQKELRSDLSHHHWWLIIARSKKSVTNFIQPYLYQFFDDSHSHNGTWKLLKRPFNRYQLHLEAINSGQDIRQINR